MKLLYILIEIAWYLAMGLLKIVIVFYVSAAVMYGIYWLYVDFSGSHWVIGITVILVILFVIGASGKTKKD